LAYLFITAQYHSVLNNTASSKVIIGIIEYLLCLVPFALPFALENQSLGDFIENVLNI
jgi:hypothetical protein